MPRPNVPKDPVRPKGHDRYLAQIASEGTRRSSSPQAFITIIWGPQSLRARVRRPELASESSLFTNWPNSSGSSPAVLPAVIAFDNTQSQPIWGFDAVHHPKRIEYLRVLLESKEIIGLTENATLKRQVAVLAGGRRSIQVVKEFLRCALEYLQLYYKSCGYSFIVPSRWSEGVVGTYAEALPMVIHNTSIKFLQDIEAGTFWMVRHLRERAQGSGVVLINSEGSIPFIA
jgi:hypothetical protein